MYPQPRRFALLTSTMANRRVTLDIPRSVLEAISRHGIGIERRETEGGAKRVGAVGELVTGCAVCESGRRRIIHVDTLKTSADCFPSHAV